jgi:ligand-binding sensor domain-containing protein/serine phosphatase RsbU (regulator of sigma subunit)
MILTPLVSRERIIRPRWRIIFLCLWLLQAVSLSAQTYYFDRYGVEAGLSSSKVYAIIQDKLDYVWLGTEAGVSKFDGVVFTNLSSENGLADGGVFSLYQDSTGMIWFGHLDGGISRYNGKTFEVVTLAGADLKGDITAFVQDKDGKLWVGTSGSGTFRIENPSAPVADLTYTQLRGKEGLSDQIFNIARTRDNKLYFLTDVGVKVLDPQTHAINNIDLDKLTRYWMLITMFEDSRGDLWFGTYNGGLYHWVKSTGEMKIYDKRDGLAKNWISYITEDRSGRIWVGTWGGGITVFDNEKMKTYDITNGLHDNQIKCILEDKEGNMLIGTYDHGLDIFKGEQFVTIDADHGLRNPIVWAILQDKDGAYWFGTNGGITVYHPSKPLEKRFDYFHQENRYIENKIRFLREDKKGDIWIGTEGGGLIKYEKRTGRFINDNYINDRLYADKIITALEVDGQNNLWIGTNQGLGYYEIETGYIERLTQGAGLAGDLISALYVDSHGALWIGSQVKGLTKCVKEGRNYVFSIVPVEKNFTPTSITEDTNGNLWIGTTKGVFVMNGDSVIMRLTEKDGILANTINLVDVDKDGNIYIGTNKGLNKYVPSEKKLYTFSGKNGFVGIETKSNASYLDRDGNIWFGTVAGVTRYNPTLTRTDVPEPLTHIRAMQVNYQPSEMKANMKLGFRQKNIVFDYNSICLTNPDAVLYQVMLEGADDDWRPVTTQTRAIYPALSPKKYTFMVKARNSLGVWNTEPITYSFTIRPPFYKTWWFILGCVIIGVFAIFTYITVREANLIREKRILEEKVVERTAEVVAKSKELEQKNKDITDSIRYAKRIQNAILPPVNAFTDTFILFKPKDIVSGDFYWLGRTEERHLIAAVDCTGHGVPGAFMSIIGYNSLNKIVKEYNITEPAAIMDQLNMEITQTLSQQSEDGEVKDGMDMSLISIHPVTSELEYAGSYNALYIVSDGRLTEIKADRIPIGRSSSITESKFTNHRVNVKKGDMVYLFSDGYADQFGGGDGSKFKYKGLKDLLASISELSLEEQKHRLDETIEQWKGPLDQVDDILLIGTRIG